MCSASTRSTPHESRRSPEDSPSVAVRATTTSRTPLPSMVDALRRDPTSRGLVTALGWFCTKHSWGVYGASPPPEGFRWTSPQDSIDREARCVSEQRDGTATVETYTVTHGSDGAPERLIIAARTPDAVRTWCHSTDVGRHDPGRTRRDSSVVSATFAATCSCPRRARRTRLNRP